jgi:hypothetical protein
LALDYLLAQALSIPSEHVFSSSAEADTHQQNHIAPALMEQLQMLKYMIKKVQLDFTSSWKCEEKDLDLENKYQDAGFGEFDKLADERFEGLLDVLEDQVSETGSDDGEAWTDKCDGSY